MQYECKIKKKLITIHVAYIDIFNNNLIKSTQLKELEKIFTKTDKTVKKN